MKIEIDTRALQVMAQPGIGWIRILGRGFAWKATRRHALLFSERKGLARRLRIGPWSFGWLDQGMAGVLEIFPPIDEGSLDHWIHAPKRDLLISGGVKFGPAHTETAPFEQWLTEDSLRRKVDPPDFFLRGSGAAPQ